MRPITVALGLALASAIGCHSSPTGGDAPRASGSIAGSPRPELGGVARLELAEQRRDSSQVSEADLSNRDAGVRRRAVRALARIADSRAAAALATTLADEDPDVVATSAFGLGRTCDGRVPATVHALVARAATLGAMPVSAAGADGLEDPISAIADALAACGDLEAERTLRSWLSGERAEAAALALGRFGTRYGRLEEASIVALLDAASADRPVANALYAFTRLGGLSESVRTRLLGVARDALRGQGALRSLAVRALEHAGEPAIPVLAGIVTSAEYTPGERADAARALGRMGELGQAALLKVVPALLGPADKTTPEQMSSFATGPNWAPGIAALDALQPPARSLRAALDRWTAIRLPETTEPTARRRIVQVRCRAAALLAGSASLSPKLVGCDPAPDGRSGALAALDVLDHGAIERSRFRRWQQFASASDPVVRQAALDLMKGHAEIAAPSTILESALRAKEPGTVARAAEVLITHPDRASEASPVHTHGADAPDRPTALRPDPKLVDALLHALDSTLPDAIETRGALMEAAGSLGLLNVKSMLETTCKDANASLRQHAADALAALGDHDRHCWDFAPTSRIPEEATGELTPVRLVFHTDAGTLPMTLDPQIAPVAVARVVRLARAGFYDGMAVHRYIPGFLVQFGDPDGDGYADGSVIPIASELAPAPFEQWAVGLALGGPDTGSTQLFVTLGRWPHLDEHYPLLGRADASWERLALGDVIRKVEVAP